VLLWLELISCGITATTIGKAGRLQKRRVHSEQNISAAKTSSREKVALLVNTWLDVLPEGHFVFVADGGDGVRFNDETFWVSRLLDAPAPSWLSC